MQELYSTIFSSTFWWHSIELPRTCKQLPWRESPLLPISLPRSCTRFWANCGNRSLPVAFLRVYATLCAVSMSSWMSSVIASDQSTVASVLAWISLFHRICQDQQSITLLRKTASQEFAWLCHALNSFHDMFGPLMPVSSPICWCVNVMNVVSCGRWHSQVFFARFCHRRELLRTTRMNFQDLLILTDSSVNSFLDFGLC